MKIYINTDSPIGGSVFSLVSLKLKVKPIYSENHRYPPQTSTTIDEKKNKFKLKTGHTKFTSPVFVKKLNDSDSPLIQVVLLPEAYTKR